jgi:hypothetical protein
MAAGSTTLQFSSEPSVSEISSARIFDEPLLSLGGEPTAAENKALPGGLKSASERVKNE